MRRNPKFSMIGSGFTEDKLSVCRVSAAEGRVHAAAWRIDFRRQRAVNTSG